MLANRKLILAHFWFAFAVFGVALTLGAWQMFIRSPIGVWLSNPELYYRSLTAHGTIMGYVFPTLVAMGFKEISPYYSNPIANALYMELSL